MVIPLEKEVGKIESSKVNNVILALPDIRNAILEKDPSDFKLRENEKQGKILSWIRSFDRKLYLFLGVNFATFQPYKNIIGELNEALWELEPVVVGLVGLALIVAFELLRSLRKDLNQEKQENLNQFKSWRTKE